MSLTVFYSWQSDIEKKDGRNFIERALTKAVSRITSDINVEEAVRQVVLDKDTKGVPGIPPIFDTILKKIDKAAIFVCDLTICNSFTGGRPAPNPNVLIEFGYALKRFGPYQIINVMNAAYGAPDKIELPFDLKNYRFPITYHLPLGAEETVRKVELERLTKSLEGALRAILNSEEFKATLPQPPKPILFIPHKAMNGKARFRPEGEPLGYYENHISRFTQQHDLQPVYLVLGPASWLHVSPLKDPGKKWKIQDVADKAVNLAGIPLIRTTGGISKVRGEDGIGYYPSTGNPKEAKAVAYFFDTGEVWSVDAWMTSIDGFALLDETAFTKSLQQCAEWLQSIGCPGPYTWSVGIEKIRGRKLMVPTTSRDRTVGVCLKDSVEYRGEFEIGGDAFAELTPFFEMVWDAAGAKRSA